MRLSLGQHSTCRGRSTESTYDPAGLDRPRHVLTPDLRRNRLTADCRPVKNRGQSVLIFMQQRLVGLLRPLRIGECIKTLHIHAALRQPSKGAAQVFPDAARSELGRRAR